MLDPFHFARTPEIIFGAGAFEQVDSIIADKGDHVLVVTGGSSFGKSGRQDKLSRNLADRGIKVDYCSVDGEPSPSLVDEIVERYRNSGVSVVCAIGGGSVMDAGKAIAAMIPLGEPVKDYLEGVGTGKKHSGATLPLIAVPTTAGTGSEATKNAVLSKVGEGGFKSSLRHDNFVPDVALVDPELHITCPAAITAASGMDAFTQLLESYASIKATPMTDALAFSGICYVSPNLVKAATTGSDDVDVRASMAYAAMLSGVTLANAGLGVVHGFASSIGGMFPISHGVICGTLIAPATRIIIERMREDPETYALPLQKYAYVGSLFKKGCGGAQVYTDELISYLDEWADTLSIPRLGAYGVTESDIPLIVKKTGIKNTPYPLVDDDIAQIVRERL